MPPLYRGVAKDNSGLGKVAERASGARRKLSRLAGREGRTREKEGKKKELVIEGSHMVSGTQCPARSDQLKKWSESRAAAPKGRCPVEHRGEFPYVLRGHISGLR